MSRRTAIKNRIRSILYREGLSLASGAGAWTQKGLKKLREMARPWEDVDQDDLWRGALHEELEQYDQLVSAVERVEAKLDALAARDSRVGLLESIPGVGPRLAETVVAIIDDPHRFKRGKQVAAAWCLDSTSQAP